MVHAADEIRKQAIEQIVAEDPALSVLVTASPVLDAWLWQKLC
jgi:hypothetical protein